MNTNTQKAIYTWFAERDFLCSFEDFAEKFEFADPSITFSGTVVYCDDEEDWKFEGLNFQQLTEPSNGCRPLISIRKNNIYFVRLGVDGINKNEMPVTITFELFEEE